MQALVDAVARTIMEQWPRLADEDKLDFIGSLMQWGQRTGDLVIAAIEAKRAAETATTTHAPDALAQVVFGKGARTSDTMDEAA